MIEQQALFRYGARRWVPVHRRMAIDIAYVARSVPSFPVHREMKLAAVESARRSDGTHVGWTALLVHAYGRVCHEIAELRDVYVRWPVPYLYRHPQPIASVTIQRRDDAGSERLIWGRIGSSKEQAIIEVQSCIQRFLSEPVAEVFGDGLRLERRAAWLRTFQWWLLTRWSGRKRAKHLGTFSISSLGGSGALNAHHPLVTTTSLAMGPLRSTGTCDVVLICDHRVIDGTLAAHALARLERTLLEVSLPALSALSRAA